MKRGNCFWIEWISYLHANPSQVTHAVQLCGLLVLYLYCTVACSYFLCFSDVMYSAAPRSRVLQKSARYQHTITSDRTVLFSEVGDFYFISYENNDRIMTLTTCQHLIWPQILNPDRAFFSGTLSLLKLPQSQIWQKCQRLSARLLK